MTKATPLRFFWVIGRPPLSAFAVAALLLSYGGYLAVRSPHDYEQIFGLALVGQMLAASTGYRDRLVRGHFDPILAGRRSRVGVALAHAAVSVVPGLVLWVLAGAIERTVHARHLLAFSAGGVTAIVYASVAVWTISLALGRHSGGVLWIFLLFLLAGGHRLHLLQEAYGTSSADLAVSFAAARAALIWPISLLSNGGAVESAVLGMVVAAVAVVFVAGVGIVSAMDAPLKEPS